MSTALTTRVKQIAAGLLDVGYVDVGPSDGPAVVLLHGWPYDIHTFAEASPLLAAAGHRVIVPYLRGYGTTRFLSNETLRNGQQSVLAVDAVALMDALGIEKAVVAGADWGARTADVVAALWPERCTGLVSVSGYLIGSQEAGALPLAPEAERQWWYQYYFATERGRLAVAECILGEEARRAVAAQEGHEDTQAGRRQQRRHLFVAVDVVGPAVQQHDRTPVWRPEVDVADVEHPGVDLPYRSERAFLHVRRAWRWRP